MAYQKQKNKKKHRFPISHISDYQTSYIPNIKFISDYHISYLHISPIDSPSFRGEFTKGEIRHCQRQATPWGNPTASSSAPAAPGPGGRLGETSLKQLMVRLTAQTNIVIGIYIYIVICSYMYIYI